MGYPQGNTQGNVWITDLQITDPEGKKLLSDGSFAEGKDSEHFVPSASYGDYAIERVPISKMY